MIKELIKLANELDRKGHREHASRLDSILVQNKGELNMLFQAEDNYNANYRSLFEYAAGDQARLAHAHVLGEGAIGPVPDATPAQAAVLLPLGAPGAGPAGVRQNGHNLVARRYR